MFTIGGIIFGGWIGYILESKGGNTYDINKLINAFFGSVMLGGIGIFIDGYYLGKYISSS